MVEVSYELYTQVKGRWNLEARYGNAEREDALNDAKNLSHDKSIDAVRLVRETYDPERGASREATIYSTVKRGEKSGGGDDRGGGGGGGYDDDYDDYDDYDDFDDGGGGYGGYGGYDEDEDEDEGGSRGRRRSGSSRFSMHTVILIKILIILMISFGFAVLMTYLFSRYIMGT